MHPPSIRTACLIALLFAARASHAYDSGSTGADGAFSPTVNTELQLPADGVFNFVSVNIPSGVTVKFKRNAANTPVILKVVGDVTIAGTIDVSGGSSPATGDAVLGDDGLPGLGGPGGHDGGRGGTPGLAYGSAGLGPGGGAGKNSCRSYGMPAGYSSSRLQDYGNYHACGAGPAYGNKNLLPLIGGSGGGGGQGGSAFHGSGGGGGGGAILIAASGVVNLAGSVRANGGAAGNPQGVGAGSEGGGGSGGAIKIIASRLAGAGSASAEGGSGAYGTGAFGRVRFEADTLHYTGSSGYSFGSPGADGVPQAPSLRISHVAGQALAAAPTGGLDLALPADVVNPVRVDVEARGIPPGAAVKLVATPAAGEVVVATGSALSGSETLSTSAVEVSLPAGPSVLQAQVSYSVSLALGERLAPLAGGRTVREIRLIAGLEGEGQAVLVTTDGREIAIPHPRLAQALGG